MYMRWKYIARFRTTLLGDGRKTSILSLIAATLISGAFAILTFVIQPNGLLSSTQYFQSIVLISFVAAATCGYFRGGLIFGWLLAGAGLLPFALTFAITDAPIGREPTLIDAISTLVMSAGLFGFVVGTGGYAVGLGIQWYRKRGPER